MEGLCSPSLEDDEESGFGIFANNAPIAASLLVFVDVAVVVVIMEAAEDNTFGLSLKLEGYKGLVGLMTYCSSLGGKGGGPLSGFKNLNAIPKSKEKENNYFSDQYTASFFPTVHHPYDSYLLVSPRRNALVEKKNDMLESYLMPKFSKPSSINIKLEIEPK